MSLLTDYQPDYSGGLNDTSSPTEINKNEASLLRNWDITYQAQLLRRDGLLQVGNTIGANPITALGAFIRNDGTDLLCAEGANFYYLSGTTWTKIADNLIPGNLWLENIQVFGKIFISNEDNNLLYWDRISTTLNAALTDLGVTIPHGNVLRWHKNHLFTLNNVNVNGTKYKNRIYWCDLGDPLSWDTVNNFFEIPGDGRAITAVDLGNNLVIFKERAIQYLSGWGNNSWKITEASSNVANVSEEVGIAGPHAATRVGNEVWFVDDEAQIRRIYQTDFDAFRKDIISTKIQGTLSGINKSQLSKIQAWTNNNKVYFAFPNATDIFNSFVCVFDLIASKRTNEEAWTTYTGWYPNVFADFPSSTTPQLYVGDARLGKVYQHTGNDDDGVSIDARWDGKDDYYKKPERYKRHAFGYIRGNSSIGSTSFDVWGSADSGPFGKFGTLSLQASGSRLGPTGTFRLGPTGNNRLGGRTQGELQYFMSDGGVNPLSKTLRMSIRHNAINQKPVVNTFSNHYKLRQRR